MERKKDANISVSEQRRKRAFHCERETVEMQREKLRRTPGRVFGEANTKHYVQRAVSCLSERKTKEESKNEIFVQRLFVDSHSLLRSWANHFDFNWHQHFQRLGENVIRANFQLVSPSSSVYYHSSRNTHCSGTQ